MRKRYILIILFGALVCMFIMNGLICTAAERGVNPYGSGSPLGPNGGIQPNFFQVPEPSTLILLGSGLTSIGVYLYSRRRGKK